jgi:hypothetical protein
VRNEGKGGLRFGIGILIFSFSGTLACHRQAGILGPFDLGPIDGSEQVKKWFVLLGLVILLVIGSLSVLSFFGVKFINTELGRRMGPGIAVSEIKIRLTHLAVRGIRYEDPRLKKPLLQIEEVNIYPTLFSFLKGELRIRELTILRPSFFFYRSRDGTFVGPWPATGKEPGETGGRETKETREGKAFQVRIDRIRIQEAAVDFQDRNVEEPPAEIRLRKVDLEVRDIQYPFASARSPVTLKGKMKGPTKEGEIELKGWINFDNLDMDTLFKVREIEVKTLEPYYRKRVSAEIESGDMTMQAKITINKKVIDAPGSLELTRLNVGGGGGSVFYIPAKTVVSLLKDRGNRINVNFHVKGNLDDPRFSLQENIMRRIGISVAEALGVPIRIVGEEFLKGAFTGTKGVAEGLRSMEELFRPKKEKK